MDTMTFHAAKTNSEEESWACENLNCTHSTDLMQNRRVCGWSILFVEFRFIFFLFRSDSAFGDLASSDGHKPKIYKYVVWSEWSKVTNIAASSPSFRVGVRDEVRILRIIPGKLASVKIVSCYRKQRQRKVIKHKKNNPKASFNNNKKTKCFDDWNDKSNKKN